MTDQVREKLIYKKRTYRITEEPLDRYLMKNRRKLPFDFMHTACWRSYEGVWKVKQETIRCPRPYIFILMALFR